MYELVIIQYGKTVMLSIKYIQKQLYYVLKQLKLAN